MIISGLKVIRLRFGLHRSELPFLHAGELKYYLLSLLNPGESIATHSNGRLRGFPRAGLGFDDDGFPRLRRLSRRDRWELAHSCNSLARSLPPSCRKHTKSKIDSWIASATTPSPPPPSDYLAFVRKEVGRMFPLGWDRQSYPNSVFAFAPRASARAETQPGCSGMMADLFWSSDFPPGHPSYIPSKPAFNTLCLTGKWTPPDSCPSWCDDISSCTRCDNREKSEVFGLDSNHLEGLPHPGGFFLRVSDIPTVGKMRTIGIPSLNYDVLGPLHKAIYNRLMSQDWLMHGSVNADRISKVCTGKIQTSVDLTNATDGLNLNVTEAILGTILRKSSAVPGFIRHAAFQSLRPLILKRSLRGTLYNYHDHVVGRVAHGQMMGTYLSFPLLCLHSYLAGAWAARNSQCKGLLVNGDDTIISHDSPLGEYPPGYVKNNLKTLTSPVTCELNSTVFMVRSGKWGEVRSLRRFGAESDFLGFRHMAGACQRAGPRWVTAFMRSRIGKSWGLSYKDLGLCPSHRLVWLRSRRARGALSNVEFPDLPADPRYDIVTDPLSLADRVAFGLDLFDIGRSRGPDKYPNGEEDLLKWNPPRSRVLRTCARPRPHRVTSTGRVFGTEHSYEFIRDYPSRPTDDHTCRLAPDQYWAQSPEGEKVLPEERGRYVLSPSAPSTVVPARRVLERASVLNKVTEWEEVVKIRSFDSGLARVFTVSPRHVARALVKSVIGGTG
jgi:hypothetical protein